MNKNSSYALLGVLVVAAPLFLSVLPSVSMAQGAGTPPLEKCPQQKTGSGAESSSLNLGAGSNIACKPKDTEGFYEGKPYQWKCAEGTKVMTNILGKPCDVKDSKSGVTTKGTCDYAEACKASAPTGQAQTGGAPQSGEQKPGGEQKQGEGGMPKMPEIPSGGGGDSGGGGQPSSGGSGQPQTGTSPTDTSGRDPNTPGQTSLGTDADAWKNAQADAQAQGEASDRENALAGQANPFGSNTSAAHSLGIDPGSPFSDASSKLLHANEQPDLTGLGAGGDTLSGGSDTGSIVPSSLGTITSSHDAGVMSQGGNSNDPSDALANDAKFRAGASFQGSFDSSYTPPQSMIQRAYNSIMNSIWNIFRF